MKNRGFDVVMLTTVHSAMDERIFDKEAKTLTNSNFSVCIIGNHTQSECIDGVWIEALPRQKNRAMRLLLGWTVLKLALRCRGALFIFHDPELFGVATILRILKNKVVYDCHENVALVFLQKSWVPLPLRWLLFPAVAAFEWLGARLMSGVIVVTEQMLKRFPQNQTVLVRNYPTDRTRATVQEGPPIHLRKNVVIYSGGLNHVRGIRELVEAYSGLEAEWGELILVGPCGDPSLEDYLLNSLPSNVRWLGLKKFQEVLQLYQTAKLGVVALHPTTNHRKSLPIKLFEYMAAGLPVIASDFPEWRTLVENCGVMVDPLNVLEIRAAVRSLLSNDEKLKEMSRNAREKVSAFYRWENEGRRLTEFCAGLLDKPGPQSYSAIRGVE